MAAVKGVNDFFIQELKIDTYVAENYANATIQGLVKLDKDSQALFKLVGN